MSKHEPQIGDVWEYFDPHKAGHPVIATHRILDEGISQLWCQVATADGRHFCDAYPIVAFTTRDAPYRLVSRSSTTHQIRYKERSKP